MKRRQIFSLLVMVFAAVMIWFLIPAYTTREIMGGDVGAAMMPKVASWLLLIFAGFDFVIQIYGSLARLLKEGISVGEADVSFGSSQILPIFIASLVLALYAWGLEPMGYLLSSFLLVVVLMPMLGARLNLKLCGVSASAVIALFVLMKYGFGSTFPILPIFLRG